jgi:hypothetical protein
MKRKLIAVFLIFITMGLVVAEGNNKFLSYYDSEMMKFNYTTFGGLSLNYQGQATSTDFGISPYFKDVLLKYDDSASSYNSYNKKITIGNSLVFGGLGVILLSLIPIMTLPGSSKDDAVLKMNLTYGIIALGYVSIVVGGFFIPSAFEDLTHSVNVFNRNKVKDFE